MFEIKLSQTRGIRNDRGKKFIPNDYLYNISNYNFDDVIGLSRILAPNIVYNVNGTAGIDGIFQFRYINSEGTLVTENIVVIDGKVYKDFLTSPIEIYNGLTPGVKCTFAVLNDKLFISNGTNQVIKYNGTITVEMGAPIATNNLVSGVLTGSYFYAMTYEIDGVETITGTTSNTLIVSTNSIDLTLPIGPTGTSARKLYRTEAGSSVLKFLVTISDNDSTTYQDNIADGSLGATLAAVNALAPKPKYITVKDEKLIGVGNARRPNYLYTSEIEIESFFATLGVSDVSGQGNDNTALTGLALDYNQIVVFSEKRIYLADVSGTSTTIQQTTSNVGCIDGHTIAKVPPNLEFKGGLMFVSNEYDIRVFNGQIAVNLATSFDNLSTQNFSSALNKDEMRNILRNVDLEGEYFDYKYHLIIGISIYVYDIRIQGWTIYLIKTASYSPVYRKFGILGENFYIGQKGIGVIEQMYKNSQYRGENFEASFETGEILVSDIYKLFKKLQIYYGNSGNVTVTIIITPDNNANLAKNLVFTFVEDGYNPEFYDPTYYEASTNVDDYRIAHINEYARWIRIKFISNNQFNFRGFSLIGEEISNREAVL